jgi:isochorismate synthase EntC
MKPNYEKNVLIHALFIAILASLTFSLFYLVGENNNNVLAQVGEQQQQQQQNNQTSIAHNAKGHESHQVIIFQNSSEGLIYTGMVTFDLSKPADVISFEEITEDQQQPVNATKKIWEVGDKKFVPSTLLKNVTEGSIGFNGSGILAHSTSGDKYTGSYFLNDTAISDNNSGSNQ